MSLRVYPRLRSGVHSGESCVGCVSARNLRKDRRPQTPAVTRWGTTSFRPRLNPAQGEKGGLDGPGPRVGRVRGHLSEGTLPVPKDVDDEEEPTTADSGSRRTLRVSGSWRRPPHRCRDSSVGDVHRNEGSRTHPVTCTHRFRVGLRKKESCKLPSQTEVI